MRVLCHNLLVELDDVGQEGECLDLSPHEVHEDLFVEVWVRFLGGGGLEGDGGHDQGDELLHVVVNLLQRSNKTLDKVDKPANPSWCETLSEQLEKPSLPRLQGLIHVKRKKDFECPFLIISFSTHRGFV